MASRISASRSRRKPSKILRAGCYRGVAPHVAGNRVQHLLGHGGEPADAQVVGHEDDGDLDAGQQVDRSLLARESSSLIAAAEESEHRPDGVSGPAPRDSGPRHHHGHSGTALDECLTDGRRVGRPETKGPQPRRAPSPMSRRSPTRRREASASRGARTGLAVGHPCSRGRREHGRVFDGEEGRSGNGPLPHRLPHRSVPTPVPSTSATSWAHLRSQTRQAISTR